MGPNAWTLIQEAFSRAHLSEVPRSILDLGGGKGLSTSFLSHVFPHASITLFDAWITPEENAALFAELPNPSRIQHVQGDALRMPFVDGTFDLVVSIDAFHYFGLSTSFVEQSLMRLLQPGSPLIVVVPARKGNVKDKVPQALTPFITEEEWPLFQPKSFYEKIFSPVLSHLKIGSMQSGERAWQEWIALDDDYAKMDRPLLEADNGQYLDLIYIIGFKK